MDFRVVSLLPSATEIVWALGLGENLVGRSHECDYPEEVRKLPALTRAKVETHAPSADIDTSVRSLLDRGLSVYDLDADLLARLRPDVVVTQDRCAVCAVSGEEVEEALRACAGIEARLVLLSARSLEGIFEDVLRVGEATGRETKAREVVAEIRERMASLRARHPSFRSRPRVLCLEWLDPPMVAGNWIPELVELGGGQCPLVGRGEPSRVVSWEEIREFEPDVLVLMPCGFSVERTFAELDAFLRRAPWEDLPAFRNGRVYVADGNAYLNRPGPRIAESAELLAGLIQPGFFAHRIPRGSYRRVETRGRV
ncbi:MAG: cobalamin-binding protein [Candidatus Binatia bacterium]|nr:MAG: cobalamin-binding protein [Candidatus Binatia bacterium]